MADSKDKSDPEMKGAIRLNVLGLEEKYEMITMYSEISLNQTISELCKKWNLDPPKSEFYQLKFDPKSTKPPPVYISEDNRKLIKNGDILLLDYTPKMMSASLIDSFTAQTVTEGMLQRLAGLSCDKTFAEVFAEVGGFVELRKYISNVPAVGKISQSYQYALNSFMDLMEHGIETWSRVEKSFLLSMFKFLDERPEINGAAVKCALIIVESIILSHPDSMSLVQDVGVDVSRFFHNIKAQNNPDLQCKCIALLNTILNVSSEQKKKEISKYLLSTNTRTLIKEKIFTMPIQADMAFQLYSLQTRLFNLLHGRLMSTINVKDEGAFRDLLDIWKLAFENDADLTGIAPRKSSDKKDFSKLGFSSHDEPLRDFSVAPPGVLALDCISFFARTYTSQYISLVLENSRERADDQDCPFARASIQLTKLLAEILSIGEEPVNTGAYYPMLFSKEKPFEEFFCICIQKFSKTWKDMKASSADFNKVLMVVREQISRALDHGPHTFDSFKIKLNQWSFSKIQEERLKELEANEEKKIQAKPIQELREMLKPEILDVIKQQRINRMIEGHYFRTTNRKQAKNKEYLLCRLSHNAKVLQYGHSADQNNEPETLQTINILDIMEIVDEKKETGRKNEWIITISIQDTDPLVLSSTDHQTHQIWLDGLNALTGKRMNSHLAEKDLIELLSIEVKLKLLDAEGLNFPETPPPIPPLPPNFNFVTA